MKRRNRRFDNQRIAEQFSHVFGVRIDKDVVRAGFRVIGPL